MKRYREDVGLGILAEYLRRSGLISGPAGMETGVEVKNRTVRHEGDRRKGIQDGLKAIGRASARGIECRGLGSAK